MKNLGLYIHIPYCTRKCNYCDFFSIVPNDNTAISQYTKTLINSILKWKDKLTDYVVDTIHIGGGTPSLLSETDIDNLLNSVSQNFTISENPEITLEGNPNSINELNIKSLKHSGINRISMGVQSMNDEELKVLGRLHCSEDVKNAIEKIRNEDITNFSLDVMLGIPLQNEDTLNNTLDFCINSGATHISTYMLKIEKNTPFYNNRQNLVFADSDTVADLYELTCEKLKSSGFRHYEISNFAKDNMISKHNMKYWMLEDYLGLGPSAHSMIDGQRFFYPRDFASFESDITEFESIGKTEEEYIMLSLRTDIGLKFETYEKMFNKNITDVFFRKAKMFSNSGLVNLYDDKITLTDKGFLVSNAIISEICDTLM